MSSQCGCRLGQLCPWHANRPGEDLAAREFRLRQGNPDPKKPERCACAESLVVREELASAAAHLATLLDLTGNTVKARESASQWLESHKERLP